MIPISTPQMGIEEKEAVARVLESGILAQGPRVAEFEHAFARYLGVKHAVATSNGTTALHAALLAHGIGPGDEVITTPFTFIASASAILYTGARPVFVDVDESFNIDASMIEAAITARTSAVMPVHLYGQPADMDRICSIARKFGLAVIEDACQAHGADFAGRRVGTYGTGCFSFYPTKNMTTGEGGMITTDDDAVAQRARTIINHGMKVRYFHEELGYNYRMTDIAAAIGLEQLKKLPGFNFRRQEIAGHYHDALCGVAGVILPRAWPNRTHVYHQYTLRITLAFGRGRDDLASLLGEKDIGTGIYYPVPVHQQESIRKVGLGGEALPVAEQMAREVLSIPVHPGLDGPDIETIVSAIISLGVG